ncbi:glycine--tRNA ligase subunit beta [Buchnera aphidicola]|uniref:glycine--tRNA ligase subunit beta n=1 Tax=Buchnera aphidicola TaxID=9 RepID=UPI003463B8F2
MNYKTFLVEIYTEELPSRMIREIANIFYKNFIMQLKKYKIFFSQANLFDSPKRIAIKIHKLDTSPIIKIIKEKGPAIKNSYYNGNLTNAALKWLKKFNINIQQTKTLKNKKGTWLLYENYTKKIVIKKILPKITIFAITNIPLLKTMKWNEHNIQFIRPIRNMIMLLDNYLVPFNNFGIHSRKYLYGNTCTLPNKIHINHAKEYENILYKYGKVIAKFHIRKKKIQYQAQKIANKLHGKINFYNSLLEEITCLVEWPNILYGKFHKKFLNIPIDIIIYTIENIQKYFPIYNIKNTTITRYFIIVSNVDSKQPNKIIYGNECVLNARLADIDFFLKNDKKKQFQKYFLLLKQIIFHEKLGTMFHKTNRMIKLIKYIAKYTKIDIQKSIQCAFLSKCDLKTNMVYEFPKLKGIIGMHYSLYYGISHEIAISIKEQYQPKFSGDKVPSTILGCLLSITDKIDTIVGFFLIGKYPKKNKDPFFLRRLTIGIIRIFIEKKININLYDTIKKSIVLYSYIDKNNEISNIIMEFIINRLCVLYQEKKCNMNIIESIIVLKNTNILDIDKKITILSLFEKNILFQKFILTHKRISNLIENTKVVINTKNIINEKLIQNTIEKKLYSQFQKNYEKIYILLKNKKYIKILKIFFTFNQPIKEFLNNISIKYSQLDIQKNRILLLTKIKNLFLTIADFSKI